MTIPNKKTVHQKILEAAANCFCKNGIKDTTLADISKSAGISKGTLYYYYSTKDELIYNIAENYLNNTITELLDWFDNVNTEKSTEDIVEEVLKKIINLKRRGKLHLYILSHALTDNDLLKVKLQKSYKKWKNILKEGIKKLSFNTSVDVDTMAYIVVTLMDGLSIQNLICDEEIPLKQITKFLV